jgi:hypothetical protein
LIPKAAALITGRTFLKIFHLEDHLNAAITGIFQKSRLPEDLPGRLQQ